MITCPRCAHPLEIRKVDQGRMWHCHDCRVSAVLLPVMRRINPVIAEELWREARTAPAGNLGCPFCRQSLQVVPGAARRPELDFCCSCLCVWCDAGERERLVRPPDPASPLPEDARIAYGRELAEQVRRRHEAADYGTGTLPPGDRWKALLGYLGFPVIESPLAARIRPWMTWSLALVLLLVHLLVLSDPRAILSSWGFMPAEVLRHGGLNVVTHFFLHVGWAHLLSNIYFLLLVGDVAEAELGRWRMAGLLLAAVMCDVMVEMALMGGSTVPRVGASGGISALMAFFVIVHPWARVCVNFRLLWWFRMPAWGAFVAWCLLQVWISFQMLSGLGSVNGIAHLTGAAIGLAAGWWWNHRTTGNRQI